MKQISLFLAIPLFSIILLTGCGSQAAQQSETPEETIHTAFTALQELDMRTFNACTNNKTASGCYLFEELTRKVQKEGHRQLAQAMVENLSWEIVDIHTQGNLAQADVIIKNKDFSDAIGNFVADLINNINDGRKDGYNLAKVITQTVDEAQNSPETLLPYLQNTKKELTTELTITLKQTDNGWQIQLDDTLCNVLTGNMGDEKISEDIEQRIAAAEELLNNNLDRWSSQLEEKSGQWSERLEEKAEQWANELEKNLQ